MTKVLLTLSSFAALLFSVACSQQPPKKETPQDTENKPIALEMPASKDSAQEDTSKPQDTSKLQQADISRLSQAFGNFLGRNLKAPGVNFDLENIINGIREGYAGKPSPMSDKEYDELMGKLQEQAFKQVSEDNLKAADEFLAKNAKEPNVVVVIPGKLQYEILTPGQGDAVEEHSTPQIKYTGKFIDGTVFGSSEEAGGAISVPLDQTIPGFSKGIVGMKEGEKRKLFVHPDVGYGTTGHLQPNSLLIFEIELIKAKTPDAESKPTADAEEDEDLDDLDDPFDNDEEDTE